MSEKIVLIFSRSFQINSRLPEKSLFPRQNVDKCQINSDLHNFAEYKDAAVQGAPPPPNNFRV